MYVTAIGVLESSPRDFHYLTEAVRLDILDG